MKEKIYFTLNQTADYLQVCPATIRNWIKTNKITVDAYDTGKLKHPLFLKQNIDRLKTELKSDTSSLLKSRRNKKYISGISKASDEIRDELCGYALALYCQKFHITSSNEIDDTFLLLLKDLCADYDPYSFLGNTTYIELENYIANKLSDIRKLHIELDNNSDILGSIYMTLRNIGTKKNKGAYFTDPALAKELNQNIFEQKNDDNKKILDPSCGTGSFLLTLPEFIPFNCIYGNDIDEISICIIRINFFLKDNTLSYEELTAHFTCSDFLTSKSKEKYDFIIGNPPWGSSLDSKYVKQLENKFSYSVKKGADSFGLFIEKGIHSLKEKGTLAFIVPKSLLTVKAHLIIRELLLEYGKFSFAKELDEAFSNVNCPSVFFVWKKDRSFKNTITIQTSHLEFVAQNRIFTPDFMPFFITNENYAKLEAILKRKDYVYLKDNADFALGIVTGNNEELLLEKKEGNALPILKGTDISRYKISAPSHFLEYNPKVLQQAASLKFYEATEKLIYRFINKRLTFALDTNKYLTLNSANILIPKLENYDIKYILGILNSDTAQFIFENLFSSVKVLRSHIEQIPIPQATVDMQQSIIYYVNQLINCENTQDFNHFDRLLNEAIWKLYLCQ